jgi:hypothetical protein
MNDVLPDEKRLDPEVKARWLEALRSGQYKQGHDALEYQGRYCCLGVLNAVCPQIPRDPGDDEYLDEVIAESFGLTADQQRTLASINDDGREFTYIADYIEKHL